MDIKAPSKEVSQEAARELLIAISYSLPDKEPEIVNGDDVVRVTNGDGAEKYRSELISISYSPPDVTPSPVALANHDG